MSKDFETLRQIKLQEIADKLREKGYNIEVGISGDVRIANLETDDDVPEEIIDLRDDYNFILNNEEEFLRQTDYFDIDQRS
ncbi:MAG TPA: hypothetical protein VK982_11480 [Bacteroidales bacterium]|nr:hypothetical protein [Bacteroidales bacterium]